LAYCQLSLDERRRINVFHEAGLSQSEIARQLMRHKSTISRELRRNRTPGCLYYPDRAHKRAAGRRKPRLVKVLGDEELRSYITEGLQRGLTPEQIANRHRLESATKQLSTRTLYRAGAQLFDQLPPSALRRWPVYRKKRGRKRYIIGRVGIEHRPPEAGDRNQVGHWEGDTVCERAGKPALAVLAERASRFYIAVPLSHANADHVAQVCLKALKPIRQRRRKTITFDNGLEFARFAVLEKRMEQLKVYFADPHSPWQRPTVENTNGLLRQYLPKGTALSQIPQKQLDIYIDAINNRPRKCLNWRTPAEVFNSS
jgi:transposase, IS30 family